MIGPIRRFGRYTLVKKLATGGMAEIWLARQRGLAGFNRFVVIKKILSHLSEQPTFVEMFLDEARMSAQLNHPNIVQIYDLGKEGDSYYIAMEFIAGENLSQMLWRGMKRGQPLSPQLASRIIADACKALHYAHHLRGSDGKSLEIVHRDISPQNILVTYEGEVKVVDFGIAKAATKSEHTKTGMLKGKFSYMSPEQCQGEPVDMRSDIFALGILLYELCTGKRLFKHESELMILDMITKRDVAPPSQFMRGISANLDAVIMRALQKSQESRYQTAQEMQIALEDYLRDEEHPATNAEVAEYMRSLFEDKIEEKRRLREEASRDDLEAAFTDDEMTEGRDPGSEVVRRRTVHGLSPSQVRVLGTPPPGSHPGHSQPGYGMPPGAMHPQLTPSGQVMLVPGPTQSGYSQPGYPLTGVGYPGYTPQSVVLAPEQGGLGAKLVIFIASIIIVAGGALMAHFYLSSTAATPAIIAPVAPAPAAPAKTGRLTLDSLPQEANIFLDDKPVMSDKAEQAKTPSDLTLLQYGTTYRFRLEKDGYEPLEQPVTMDDTKNGKTLTPRLMPKPGKLAASVTGDRSAEVVVYFNGEEVGSGPEVTKVFPAYEPVVIDAKLPGMRCSASEGEQKPRALPARVNIPRDGVVRTTIRCERGRPERVAAGDPGRSRKVHEEHEAKAPAAPAAGSSAPAGEEGGGSPGCKPNPGLGSGYITIGTTPVADIYIGGHKVGQTPLASYKVPAGCVEVKAVSATGKSVLKKLTVEPNKVSIYRFPVE